MTLPDEFASDTFHRHPFRAKGVLRVFPLSTSTGVRIGMTCGWLRMRADGLNGCAYEKGQPVPLN